MNQVRVLTFGSFDPLHEGHKALFKQVKQHGDHLTVIVARDHTIQEQKKHPPRTSEHDRLEAVSEQAEVDVALLGDVDPRTYQTLKSSDFEILALGYDQYPSDQNALKILRACGKPDVKIIRLNPHEPERYKSSIIEGD